MEKTVENELASQEEESKFYIVSPGKFLLLFFGTFGFYSVYWFYKNWSLYRQSTGEEMWPVMRAIFSIFFIHSLFIHFECKYKKQTGEAPSHLGIIATVFVVVVILGRVFDTFVADKLSSPFNHMLAFLPPVIMGWCLYQGQKVANAASGDVSGRQNHKLTPVNYLWLLLGGLFWVLILANSVAYIIGLLLA